MTWMLVIAAALALLLVFIYNHLVRDRNRVDGAWSDVDVQLQRRHDLIPQLVTAVDRYAGYERATLEAVTALRDEAMALSGDRRVDELGKTEAALDEGVSRLIALAESYPDLKASENFLNLQEELAETENQLQFARRFYNGAVRQFNTRVETVPNNLVAGAFGFTPREFYQKASDEAGSAPKVDLGPSG
jgi:LemA protein